MTAWLEVTTSEVLNFPPLKMRCRTALLPSCHLPPSPPTWLPSGRQSPSRHHHSHRSEISRRERVECSAPATCYGAMRNAFSSETYMCIAVSRCIAVELPLQRVAVCTCHLCSLVVRTSQNVAGCFVCGQQRSQRAASAGRGVQTFW